jgi:hypothetical protein
LTYNLQEQAAASYKSESGSYRIPVRSKNSKEDIVFSLKKLAIAIEILAGHNLMKEYKKEVSALKHEQEDDSDVQRVLRASYY